MTPTVKAACITTGGAIVVAIIMILFSRDSAENTTKVQGNTGNTAVVTGGENVVINQGIPTPPANPRPVIARFKLDDPLLEIVRFYTLDIENDQQLVLGSCPREPCFIVTLVGAELTPKPIVHVGIGGTWAGISVQKDGFNFSLPLANRCGFTFKTGEYDLLFEVVDDRVSNLRAVLGALRGSGPTSGIMMKEVGCQPD